jgi:hypothetical protein
MKTLNHIDILNEDEAGHELSIVMDNCGGHNKNCMALRLALYLVEVGFFQTINLIFLVRGHTKNSLVIECLTCCRKITTDQTVTPSRCWLTCFAPKMWRFFPWRKTTGRIGMDWENWDVYLDRFYMRSQSGTIQCNHIFSVAHGTGETFMSHCEADGEEIKTRKFKRGKATLEEHRTAMKETTKFLSQASRR